MDVKKALGSIFRAFLKLLSKPVCLICFFVAAVIVCYFLIFWRPAEPEKPPEIITQATLESMLNGSDLSTLEAVYNGIAAVESSYRPNYNDYYVYYEAKVKAGIDFAEITVSVDNLRKEIHITLPEVKITDISVDITSLDYIFQNEAANTISVAQEAYRRCVEDVTNESAKEAAIYELAQENAKNMVQALIDPFVKQLDDSYELHIESEGTQ